MSLDAMKFRAVQDARQRGAAANAAAGVRIAVGPWLDSAIHVDLP